MKIEKKNFKKNKLLKLNIIKTQLYKKISNHFLNLNDIIFRFKQALQIIYKYHINNKKILFIGFPTKIENKFQSILKNTNHILIPNFFWVNGFITNPKKCLNYLFNNQKLINTEISKILFLLNTKVDLVVVLNSNAAQNILNESYVSKIPVIYLNNYLNVFDSRATYKIPGNFKFSIKNPRNNFFYSIIYSLLKRAQQNTTLNTIASFSNTNKQYLITNLPNQKLIQEKKTNYNKYKKPHRFSNFKK
jgi:ribosomal protein S2